MATGQSMRCFLVTGGAGFIGSCLVRQLVDEGGTLVVNLDKLTYAGNLDSLGPVLDHPAHHFVQGDIGDAAQVAGLLQEYRPQAVINLAAESHVDRSIDAPAAFLETNVMGTFNLLQTARAYWERLEGDAKENFRLLHVSTDEVYGSLGPSGSFSEASAYAPNSPYSASKASADHFVRAFYHTYGLPVLTTVCSNNYGPYQFPEKLIPLMILNALEGKPLPVYGDGKNVRDWLFIEDHCRAIRAVVDHGKPGETYNIGGNCEQTNLEIVKLICELVDRLQPGLSHAPSSSLIRFVEDRPGHDRRYAMDAAKIRHELRWRPRQDFVSGLEQTVQWYIDHRPWVERITSGVYQRQRLGLGQKAM